jgi:hypothetical protein
MENTVEPEITHTLGGCKFYGLLEVMAFLRFIYLCFIETGGFKSYQLLEVMGYHSMGYLRFDCTPFSHSKLLTLACLALLCSSCTFFAFINFSFHFSFLLLLHHMLRSPCLLPFWTCSVVPVW